MITTTQNPLKQRWEELLAKEPKLRIRDAATRLGVSEAELLATDCGKHVTHLTVDWRQFIQRMPQLGRVLCLTRNESAVHERYGTFTNEISFPHGPIGQVLGPEIDLRLFMNEWKHSFAIHDQNEEGPRISFQVFDANGTAVHKIFTTDKSNLALAEEWIEEFASENQSPELNIEPVTPPRPDKPDSEITIEEFRAAWLVMKDTHDFFPLLRRFSIGRLQALRLAPEGYAKELDKQAVETVLQKASTQKIPIMVFVDSPGCIQIHTGPVTNIKPFGEDWLNVLDDDFNLHLFMPKIDRVWLVRKPTTDGMVTSVELFDKAGQNIALFFGKRKPGQPEDLAWRELAESLAGGK